MAANDVTYLRFYAADEQQIPSVAPDDLTDITSELRLAANAILKRSGVEGHTFDVRFAWSPRKGCLEFGLVPDLINAAGEVVTVGVAQLGNLPVDTIWKIIFGERGIIDLIRSGKKQTDPAVALASGPATQATIALRMTNTAVQDKQIVANVVRLMNAATSTHHSVVDVTIEIRDEGELSLRLPENFGRPERRPGDFSAERRTDPVPVIHRGRRKWAALYDLYRAGDVRSMRRVLVQDSPELLPTNGMIRDLVETHLDEETSWRKPKRPAGWEHDEVVMSGIMYANEE